MDGFDLFTLLKEMDAELHSLDVSLENEREQSNLIHMFFKECRARNMPTSAGKTVINSFCGNILGGEMDGFRVHSSTPAKKERAV